MSEVCMECWLGRLGSRCGILVWSVVGVRRESETRGLRIRTRLPVLLLAACTWARGGTEKPRLNFRSLQLTCPLILTICSHSLTLLPSLTLFTDGPRHVVIFFITYYWYFGSSKKESTYRRDRKAKPAPYHWFLLRCWIWVTTTNYDLPFIALLLLFTTSSHRCRVGLRA